MLNHFLLTYSRIFENWNIQVGFTMMRESSLLNEAIFYRLMDQRHHSNFLGCQMVFANLSEQNRLVERFKYLRENIPPYKINLF